jgi:hypothetical protein
MFFNDPIPGRQIPITLHHQIRINHSWPIILSSGIKNAASDEEDAEVEDEHYDGYVYVLIFDFEGQV